MEKKNNSKSKKTTPKKVNKTKSIPEQVRGKVGKEVKKSVKTSVNRAKKDKKLMKKLTVVVVVLLIVAIAAVGILCYLNPALFQSIKDLLGFKPDEKGKGTVGITPIEGDKLVVNVVDVGQGDGIFVQFPDGKVMVIDIGSEFGTNSPWTTFNGILQKAKVKTIDYLMFTHTDYDHTREGKKLLDNYQIKEIYMPKVAEDADISSTWTKLAKACQDEVYIQDGQTKDAVLHENIGDFEIKGEGWIMKCHSFGVEDYPQLKKGDAEKLNSVSPICDLQYGGRSVVFTGDANFETEEYLLAQKKIDNIDADILKVGHHGSATSTSNDFLEKIDAEFAMISTNGKSYGHPTPSLLARLTDYRDVKADGDLNGIEHVYRTDKDGTIVVEIGANGILNLISSLLSDNNRTLANAEVKTVIVSSDKIIYFATSKKEVA